MDSDEEIIADVDEVGKEFEALNDAGCQLNEMQNNLMVTERSIRDLRDDSERKRIDLRLKYGKKIDHANRYHAAKKEAARLEGLAQAALERHNQVNKELTATRQNMLMDLDGGTSAKLSGLREAAKDALKEHATISEEHTRQLAEVARLHRRQKRNIEATEEYFTAKEEAQTRLPKLLEDLKGYREGVEFWRSEYARHMEALREISEDVHMQRTTRRLLDERLKEAELGAAQFDRLDSIDDLDVDTLWREEVSGANGQDTDEDARSVSSLTDSISSTNSRNGLRRGMITARESEVATHPLAL